MLHHRTGWSTTTNELVLWFVFGLNWSAAQIGRFFAFYFAAEQCAIILAVTVIIPKLQGVAPWPLPSDQPFLSVLIAGTALLLLAFATLVGTNRLFRKRVPSGQNVFSRCYGTIKTALHNKKRYKQRRLVLAKSRNQQISPPKNVLDHFLDDHNCERDKECDFGRKNVCGQSMTLVLDPTQNQAEAAEQLREGWRKEDKNPV
uniref:Uncharacterized protein n=1 Tax=Globodera rostochiensis TaxID=31243 RepID=A0A914H6Y9_GLORO